MNKTGSCLCGAVRFKIDTRPKETAACHCSMCRKWTGGIYLAFEAAPDGVTFDSTDNIATYRSSDWAERGFCKTCGSNLFYRMTAEGPHKGTYHFCLGALDDASGVTLSTEIYIDEKPDGYAFAGETTKMTGAEVMAMFAPPD